MTQFILRKRFEEILVIVPLTHQKRKEVPLVLRGNWVPFQRQVRFHIPAHLLKQQHIITQE